MVLDDVVTIVFTMASDNGYPTTKEMQLFDVRFSQSQTLSVNNIISYNNIIAYPNPMRQSTTFKFFAYEPESLDLVIYNQLGKIVSQSKINTRVGENEFLLKRMNLSSGLYFCKLISKYHNYNPLKLIIN